MISEAGGGTGSKISQDALHLFNRFMLHDFLFTLALWNFVQRQKNVLHAFLQFSLTGTLYVMRWYYKPAASRILFHFHSAWCHQIATTLSMRLSWSGECRQHTQEKNEQTLQLWRIIPTSLDIHISNCYQLNDGNAFTRWVLVAEPANSNARNK